MVEESIALSDQPTPASEAVQGSKSRKCCRVSRAVFLTACALIVALIVIIVTAALLGNPAGPEPHLSVMPSAPIIIVSRRDGPPSDLVEFVESYSPLPAIDRGCLPSHDFGYTSQNPCVFLKLSGTKGWTPKPPEKSILTQRLAKESREDVAWVECDGITGADKENMGLLTYSPISGFPINDFPKPNATLIAVQLNQPFNGVVIGIRCQLFAKDLSLDDDNASVTFNILLN